MRQGNVLNQNILGPNVCFSVQTIPLSFAMIIWRGDLQVKLRYSKAKEETYEKLNERPLYQLLQAMIRTSGIGRRLTRRDSAGSRR